MTEWGLNPESISAAATIVASLALIVAVIGAFSAHRQSRKDRSLQAFVALSLDVRERWEREWKKFVREELPLMSDEQKLMPETIAKLDTILNWLDWMGLIMRMGLIEKELLLGTLQPMIVDILRESAYKVRLDLADPLRGPSWWKNIDYIASMPEVTFDPVLWIKR